MRKEHIQYLTDPITKHPFELIPYEEDGDHVVSGILISAISWYPIIGGIPRILIQSMREQTLRAYRPFFEKYQSTLPPKVRDEWQQALQGTTKNDGFDTHQEKTADSFAFEWKHIYQENDYEEKNFFHFLSPYMQKETLRGMTTVDIGCGSGRFTKWAALSGTKVSFGTDLGESVQVAYELTKNLPNVCIVQADIYAMPFHAVFDLAYSIGVLHHLPNPQEGFLKLPSVLRNGGKMLIWVYNRRNNARALYFYEPLRSVMRHIPKRLLYALCYLPAAVVHVINELTHLLNELGFVRAAKRVPFSYYANFPFNMKLNDAFDVLATPKSNYYYVEEIIKWFNSAHLKEVQAYEHPEAGITCVGTHG